MSTPSISPYSLCFIFATCLAGLSAGCGKDSPDKPDDDVDDSSVEAVETDGGVDAGPDEPDAAEEEDAGSCIPQGCDDFGYECGIADDGCGGELDCGDNCKAPEFCGEVVPNQCGCVPVTCQALAEQSGAAACGVLDDGCGGTEDCGDDTCAEGDICGLFEENVCGCRPNLGACGEGAECGTADDGCGGVIQCGDPDSACGASESCNDSTKQCECKPAAELCQGRCGGAQVIDGCEVDCGPCDPAASCEADAACTQCSCGGAQICGDEDACCTPDPNACAGSCGEIVDNCGRKVQCGCADGLVCAQEQCIEPLKAAMLGKYALRNVSFARQPTGEPARSVTLSITTLALDQDGDVTISERACGVRAYLPPLAGAPVLVASVEPERATGVPAGTPRKLALPAFPSPGTMELMPSDDLRLPGGGAVEWYMPEINDKVNTLGWRKEVEFCPDNATYANPLPPDEEHPAYKVEDFASGGVKPWLPAGQKCRCPHEEAVARCVNPPAGESVAACQERVVEGLPVHLADQAFGKEITAGLPEHVTDCRVTDDDNDGKPGISLTIEFGGEGEAYSVNTSAVHMWGKIDPNGKHHWAVSQDIAGKTQSSFVACEVTGAFAESACAKQFPVYCPGIVDNKLSNRTDLVSLDDLKPSAGGGWDCQKLWDEETAVFVVNGEPIPNGQGIEPSKEQCPATALPQSSVP